MPTSRRQQQLNILISTAIKETRIFAVYFFCCSTGCLACTHFFAAPHKTVKLINNTLNKTTNECCGRSRRNSKLHTNDRILNGKNYLFLCAEHDEWRRVWGIRIVQHENNKNRTNVMKCICVRGNKLNHCENH